MKPTVCSSDSEQFAEYGAATDLELNELQRPPSEMRDFILRYKADRAGLNRAFPIALSPTYKTRMERFYTDWDALLQRLDFGAMSHEGRIDYLLFKNHLDYELRQLEIGAKAQAETASLLPFMQTILDLVESRRRMEPIASSDAATLLNDLNRQITRFREVAEAKSETPKFLANRAAQTVDSLRDALRGWFDFYNGYDPIFTWWTAEPYKALDQTLQDYSALLREELAGIKPGDETAIIGNPIGREALLSELAHEMIPYTPEELIVIAEREFAWCEAEMKKAARELGYGDDRHKALEHVKRQHVEPGKQPQLIRDLALEAIQFLDDHDLVTVPDLAREIWRIEMMSPERQRVNPFFTGGEVISVSYPTNTMAHEQKWMSMRGNNIHFARATVFHELIPGHHLQLFMADRYRTHRRLFNTPFYVEGWALHWEMLLWDMGFAHTPENRIGALFWRAHRCARIVFSLNFHLGKMTPEECSDFLVERVGHERENATAEVRRSVSGEAPPLYQCAYMLGGLQMRALHKELVAMGKMTDREFHDTVLQENSIPIALLRASLLKLPLTRDFEADWKFDGS